MTAHPTDIKQRSVSSTSALIMKKSNTLNMPSTSNPKVHVRIVPSIDDPSRCIIFDIVDRELEAGAVIKIGRYSDRHANTLNCMSFKSKVVSRCHCEIFIQEDGKIYLRDTKSSSGTFLNHVRLSPAGSESKPTEIHDGDIVQLGVDFQGGREEVYRSVKMKFELNRNSNNRPLSYNLNAFQNIRTFTQPKEEEQCHLDECCICLYAMSPAQALFISPCSHTYHFKCIRPLLQSYPGFQCPICRQYSDLEANVATEEEKEEEVKTPSSDDSLPRVETVTRITEHEETSHLASSSSDQRK
ncbi:SMAD/FHA domain-containing protein [Choanephora cucurbitarum]|nr:SMAD/FHA domain-containing protein [Choanephora cucurbitarum]